MASSIPAATAYFVTLATSALAATTQVIFQKEMPAYVAPITLQITEIIGDQEWATLSPDLQREETYSIMCIMTSYAGDTDFLTRMQEAFASFELIMHALGADPTLGGTVRDATVGNFNVTPEGDVKGQSICQIEFAVRCEKRVSSLT
jgi:hypothetical protein